MTAPAARRTWGPVGGLAIERRPGQGASPWHVVHVASGLRLDYGHPRRELAYDARVTYLAVPLDWTRVTPTEAKATPAYDRLARDWVGWYLGDGPKPEVPR